MKILIYSDPHFSEYSSIFRSKDYNKKFSNRLLNQIDTLNWIEALAIQKGCSAVVCAGDFFDKPSLNSAELTALRSIEWSNLSHYFLVGNHEMGTHDLFYNSVNAINAPNSNIIAKPYKFMLDDNEICFLPYNLNSSAISLSEIFGGRQNNKRLIISHNDIAGIQMGSFISKEGLKISDIKEQCDLFINGHLHNCSQFADNAFNIGNITGQNFSEDGFNYKHFAMIIDLTSFEFEFVENPYAVYFYKIDLSNSKDVKKDCTDILLNLSNKSVLTIRCKYDDTIIIKDIISQIDYKKIYDYRFININDNINIDIDTVININTIDHIQKFKDSFIEKYGSNDVILSELQAVLI